VPPKQRQIRVEQRSALASMQQLETRSDEELEAEQKHKAAAQAILGARASERYDAAAARKHFQRAIAAARPQERMALRRMADASLALAERRPDDLKQAVERLGQAPPSGRQLLLLRLMGLLAPPPGAGKLARVRGIAIIVGLVIALVAIGFGLAKLVALPFGGISTPGAVLLGLVIVALILGGLTLFGRRRQKRAQAARAAQRAP
jgi:LPXTG-motif cell wall-anchored protein